MLFTFTEAFCTQLSCAQNATPPSLGRLKNELTAPCLRYISPNKASRRDVLPRLSGAQVFIISRCRPLASVCAPDPVGPTMRLILPRLKYNSPSTTSWKSPLDGVASPRAGRAPSRAIHWNVASLKPMIVGSVVLEGRATSTTSGISDSVKASNSSVWGYTKGENVVSISSNLGCQE